MFIMMKCKIYKENKLLNYEVLIIEKNLVLWIIFGMQIGIMGLKLNDFNLMFSGFGEWFWRVLEVKILRFLKDSKVGVACIYVVD